MLWILQIRHGQNRSQNDQDPDCMQKVPMRKRCVHMEDVRRGSAITRLPGDTNSIRRAESQPACGHPHRRLPSPRSTSSPVHAKQHSFTARTAAKQCKFGLGLRNLPDSRVTKPGLKGVLLWERHSILHQSSRLYQTCLIQSL